MANLDFNVPNSPTTVFNVASMSKQFTAASVALLAQQGKISLADNVRKYVPEIPDYGTPVTVGHLVYHTSGIRDYTDLIELGDDRIENIHTDQDILRILARQKKLNFKPGAQHLYSNSGYVLLGIIVERVTGKTLGEFQRESIFQPLGMRHTRLYDDRTMVVSNRASGYFPKGDNNYGVRASLWDRVGDGGLLTTVEDLFLWDQNFYEPKVGGRALVDQLTTPGTLDNGEKFEYAFGLEPTRYRNLPIIMHGGGIRGFRAQMYRFPEQKTSIICLCNNGAISPTRMIEQIADIYLAGDFSADKPAGRPPEKKQVSVASAADMKLPEKELARFTGLYANPGGETVRRVYVRDGKLWYHRNAGSESELSSAGADRFRMLGVPDEVEVTFALSETGNPLKLSLVINGAKPIIYEHVEPAHELPAQLAAYAGTYYSEELDAKYEIVFQDNKLAVRRQSSADITLSPQYADVYADTENLGGIRFLRGKGRRVSGFVLNAARVKELHFKKL